jgi:hypothetical protein
MQEEVFHEVADEFISLANQLSEHRQRTVEYLSEQYRRMIEESLVELSQATPSG